MCDERTGPSLLLAAAVCDSGRAERNHNISNFASPPLFFLLGF